MRSVSHASRAFTTFIAGLGLLCGSVGTANAQGEMAAEAPPEPIRVMVLGAYHFGNPGLDINNIDADDVATPPRQAELEALSDALLEFRPTVVAHEGRSEAPYLDGDFAEFTPEDFRTDRNEIVQIAYRIAHDAGIERVYAIDEQPSEGEPDYFPYGYVKTFAERTGAEDDLQTVSDMSAFLAAFESAQSTETIPELLLRMNGDAFTDSFYWEMLKFGQGEDQPGPELAAYWFMRNAKIFNKLHQSVEPGDHVLVVYGAGHNHWLRDMVEKTPGYELEPVAPYLRRAAEAAKVAGHDMKARSPADGLTEVPADATTD